MMTVTTTGNTQVVVTQRSATRKFSFSGVYGPASKQSALYDDCVRPMMDAVLEGYNATILAYGQSGSGKTYTMVGTEEDPGLMGERCEREGGARGAPWHHARISETLPLSLPPQSSRCGTSSATSATTRTTSGT